MRYNANDFIGMNFSTKGMFLFMMVAMILLPFVADKKESAAKNIDPPNPGTLRVELFWPDEQNIDVDLWVAGPIGKPVGYSNLGGEIWNLQRDDLGRCDASDMAGGYCATLDSSERNFEEAKTRGIWDGEYIVNVHLFNLKSGKLPVPCKVIVYYKEKDDAPAQQLFFSNVELKASGQELTVFRFMVKNFKVDMQSLNDLQVKLRPKDVPTPNQ